MMARILESYYAEPRRIQLFFYYPSDEYISYLMTVEELMFTDEIVCMDLFPGRRSKREDCDIRTGLYGIDIRKKKIM